jgi:hypothetical protein
MALGKAQDSNPAGAAGVVPADLGRGGLASLLRQPVQLAPENERVLREAMDVGLKFFEKFNESRLNLAFGSFDADMKKALYEVIFLLHVNDPKLKEYTFAGVELERIGGVVRERTVQATADLYVEGAPHGVQGIDKLSPVFRETFNAHIQQTFGLPVPPISSFGYNPIVSIHSLGSIGTVGHKSRASDLDLQVQYELEPFLLTAEGYTDAKLVEDLQREIGSRAGQLRVERNLPEAALQDPAKRAELESEANRQIAETYPNLYAYLVTKERSYTSELTGAANAGRKTQATQELTRLIRRAPQLARADKLARQEALLQQRLKRIQEYVNKRYPTAELYLFSCSNDDYRRGHHGSTLTNKEASGSAYELILNYETLMPGIQLTPMVPSHFLLPKAMNNDAATYERMVDYIRFGLLDIYKDVRARLVNLGATPDLDVTYIAKHSGAVYWEAFKASSGNLPKAILNLFRYEMLLDKRYNKTNIQIIKDPRYLNAFVTPKPTDVTVELEQMMNEGSGVPPWVLLEMEDKEPRLLQDPWWQRFKALKIAFGEPNGIEGMEESEHKRISRIIDMAFALHVRISDVFTKPGDTRAFASYREQTLINFLKRAFPPISQKRKFLEHLFIGEVRSVNLFELEMRALFKSCLRRVNQKIASFNIQGQSNQKEFEIWYHYYQQNFEPAPNVVPKTILKHLTVARTRMQIGCRLNEGWFFQSVQRESKVGKRFDTFGYLDHLPEIVILRERSTFLGGLVDCVINGYYGILNQGTLKESRTVIEFDAKAMDLGNRTDNTLAYLRPDNVHRILTVLLEFFKYRPYHYMDCINQKREVTEVMLLLNVVKYGRLSAVFRDNLQTWYVEEVEIPEIHSRAHNMRSQFKALVTAKPLHMALARFFKTKGINLSKAAITAWVNPNSVETSHSAQQVVQKEKELSEQFLRIVMAVHNRPAAAPPAQGAGAAAPAGASRSALPAPGAARPPAPGQPPVRPATPSRPAIRPAAPGRPAVPAQAGPRPGVAPSPARPGAPAPARPGAPPAGSFRPAVPGRAAVAAPPNGGTVARPGAPPPPPGLTPGPVRPGGQMRAAAAAAPNPAMVARTGPAPKPGAAPQQPPRGPVRPGGAMRAAAAAAPNPVAMTRIGGAPKPPVPPPGARPASPTKPPG